MYHARCTCRAQGVDCYLEQGGQDAVDGLHVDFLDGPLPQGSNSLQGDPLDRHTGVAQPMATHLRQQWKVLPHVGA